MLADLVLGSSDLAHLMLLQNGETGQRFTQVRQALLPVEHSGAGVSTQIIIKIFS